ncbi:MAG: hypothetical protein ABIB04_04255 [Patescibacteria group bacterium]
MRKKYFLSLFVLACLLLAGSGCASSKIEVVEAPGLKSVSLGTLDSAEAAQKINLVRGNTIKMKQKFSEAGVKLADAYAMGSEGERELVIRRFAPGFNADIEWKYKTMIGDETANYSGAVVGGDLQSAHELFLPVYWQEGEKTAMGSGIIWLSQDVFENLSKAGVSTFSFGILNKEENEALVASSTKNGFNYALSKLDGEVRAIIGNKDVYLTTAEKDFGEYTLKVNGEDVKVQVIKASNWFGEILVLNNKQNPMVLKVTTNDLAGGDLAGFYDYEITELNGLVE